LFVANHADGTLSILTTTPFAFGSNPDLSLALAETGLLGELILDPDEPDTSGVWTDAELQLYRPSLAHPRALAMTDSHVEDRDETLYVTEFFSQPLPGVESDLDYRYVDRNRQGVVYPISVRTGQVAPEGPIFLPPVRTGFRDAEGHDTTCFPNQLYAAAVDGNRLFVTSVCASPRGPTGAGPNTSTPPSAANFSALSHGAVFVIDTDTNTVVENAGIVMPQKLRDQHGLTPTSRMPLIPNDIVVGKSLAGAERAAYLTALGADAVFHVDYGTDGIPAGIGRVERPFIDLHPTSLPSGRLPIGLAVSRVSAKPFALVLSESSRNLAAVDLGTDEVLAVVPTVSDEVAGERIDGEVSDGKRLFATGLGAWSLQGQAWSSCESCHPEGGSDGVTWLFPRGPRRTISTAGTYVPGRTARRMLLWTANVDEVHDVEAIARGVSGGVGGVLWNYNNPTKDCRLVYDGSAVPTGAGMMPCPAPKPTTDRLNGLNGSLAAAGEGALCETDASTCNVNAASDWEKIDAFIRSVTAPRQPLKLNQELVRTGRELFVEAGCNVCHGGPGWTVSRVFYEPGFANNGRVPSMPPTGAVALDELRGRLRIDEYTTTSSVLQKLNPPVASGRATFRSYAPAGDTDTDALNYIYGSSDTINCVLRAVGTFPQQPVPDAANPTPPANLVGIVAPGAPPVIEVRQALLADMSGYMPPTLALGGSGFNVPSLLGLSTGAPYFHAGNARTLEEIFDPTFKAHYQAIKADFLEDEATRAEQIKALVSYLLSLEETEGAALDPVPSEDTLGFDPDPCGQFPGSLQ
jgi:mono/diheme cytochrome c family protein